MSEQIGQKAIDRLCKELLKLTRSEQLAIIQFLINNEYKSETEQQACACQAGSNEPN